MVQDDLVMTVEHNTGGSMNASVLGNVTVLGVRTHVTAVYVNRVQHTHFTYDTSTMVRQGVK